jgi:HEPN domain-containing protein
MEKAEYLEHWKVAGNESWDDAVFLYKGERNMLALFAFHLSLEKYLKAHWVKDNIANFPPRTLNLLELYNQTELDLTFEQIDYLNALSFWNIEGRYPDFKNKLHKIATSDYIAYHIPKLEDLRQCLLKEL